MRNIFETIFEIVGWLWIVLSMVLIGGLLGFIVYANFRTDIGLAAGIALTVLGFIIGILIAIKKYQGKGTIEFLSRVSATPELDQKEEEDVDSNTTNK